MKHVWPLILALALLPACDDGGGGGTAQMGGAGGSGGATGADAGPGGSGGGAGGAPITPPVARFEVAESPAETRLGHIPFPSDIYRTADGHLDLSGVSALGLTPIVQSIIDAIEEDTPGFGTAAGFYLAFDGPLDLGALPTDAAASLTPESTLFVVDVDGDSPEYGKRWPLNWRSEAEETRYLPAHALKVRLVDGFALRGDTTYALIATTGVAEASEAFQQTLGEVEPSGPLGAAWRAHAPLRAWLAENPTVQAATAAVFTTQDATSHLFTARDYLHTLDVPELLEVRSRGEIQSRFEVYEGRYRAPRFQEGDIPYTTPGQGKIYFDDDGNPIIQGYEDLRFALSVPLGEMPEGGWPLVLYAHGTGGDYHSFISTRSRVASVLAAEGIAVLGMDQLHHGDRDAGACDGADSACVQLLYFNFQVPLAGRDNQLQSALDLVNLLRFGREINFSADISQTDRAVRIDPSRVMFMGHSQGALNGPLFAAIEPDILGAVFSGGGSQLAITLELKTEPFDLNLIIKQLAGLSGEALDRFHPAASLVQTFLEVGDSVNFARYWFDEPPEGHAPKSIFMTIGMQDQYTPAESGMAMAAAGRVPIIEPVEAPIEALELLGIEPAGIPPYSGNVAGGAASAGVAQYGNSGHFTIFEIPSARNRYGNFLRDLSRFDNPVPGIY